MARRSLQRRRAVVCHYGGKCGCASGSSDGRPDRLVGQIPYLADAYISNSSKRLLSNLRLRRLEGERRQSRARHRGERRRQEQHHHLSVSPTNLRCRGDLEPQSTLAGGARCCRHRKKEVSQSQMSDKCLSIRTEGF